MKWYFRIFLFLIYIIIIEADVSAQTPKIFIEAGKGINFHTKYHYSEPNDDVQLKTSPVQMSFLNISARINNLEVRLIAEQQALQHYTYHFKHSGLKNISRGFNPQYIRRSYRLGIGVLYFLNISNEKLEPYGGLSFERVLFGGPGAGGIGHPFIFPYGNPDHNIYPYMQESGFSATAMLGSYYNFSPRFAVMLQSRLTNWIGKDSFVDYEVKYYSDELSYEITISDIGRMLIFTAGLRFTMNGRNY